MQCDELSKNLEKINISNSLKKLDVYYCIDLDQGESDLDNISKCLETYIIVTLKDYKLDKFKRVDYTSKDKSDVVKSGLCTFNKMYNDLKLKSSNETWFVYISNGDIKDDFKNIFLLLLNKKPTEKCSYYIINKNEINIKKNDTNTNKLTGLKFLKKTIHELFNTNRSIKYTNLIDTEEKT
jgi:hypothetical protein